MTTPVVVQGFTVDIDPAEVLRFLGSKGRAKPAPGERWEEIVREAIRAASPLIEPKGVYAYAAGRELRGSTIFAHLERMAFCISTIGPAIEAEVTRLAAAGELLRAVVLDAIGSVAAEAAAEHIDRLIAAEVAAEGLKTSCRASPGYGDWDVREQSALFALLPAERIGVRLGETFMMTPRKSISFAIDVAREPARLRSESSCGNCGRTDCLYRLE
jgi:hypothetical protein